MCVFVLLSGLGAFFQGCSSLYGPAGTAPPYTDDEIQRILENLYQQEGAVESFYSVGSMLVRHRGLEMEAGSLIAGIRDPLRIKIELTHTWGQPLLHILIEDNRLEIFSYQDNRLYQGAYTSEALSRFLPLSLDTRLVWAFLKGSPQVLEHWAAVSPWGGRIMLLDSSQKEIEVMDIQPETLLPESVSFPQTGIRVRFEEFREHDGVYAAGRVQLKSEKSGSRLILDNRRIVFDKEIPEKIFSLTMPPSYETVDLDEES